MKKSVLIISALAATSLVFCLILVQDKASVTSAPVLPLVDKNGQEDKADRRTEMSKGDNNIKAVRSGAVNIRTLQPLPREETKVVVPCIDSIGDLESIVSARMKGEPNFPLAWLSDSEADRMPIKHILSKARFPSRGSSFQRQIVTKNEAAIFLSLRISFHILPSRAFESEDYFFFSAPATVDFRRGIIVMKKTGEIGFWDDY